MKKVQSSVLLITFLILLANQARITKAEWRYLDVFFIVNTYGQGGYNFIWYPNVNAFTAGHHMDVEVYKYMIMHDGVPSLQIHLKSKESHTMATAGQKLDVFVIINTNRQGEYIVKWYPNANAYTTANHMHVVVHKDMIFRGAYPSLRIHLTSIGDFMRPNPPLGYEYIPGLGYYKFFYEGAGNYIRAKQICEADGAHLAIINSNEEAIALKKLYNKYPGALNFAWLGFNDMVDEGNYVTIFGEPLHTTGYIKWERSNPNHGGKEDCGAMDREGLLHDLGCDMQRAWPFFCEFKLSSHFKTMQLG